MCVKIAILVSLRILYGLPKTMRKDLLYLAGKEVVRDCKQDLNAFFAMSLRTVNLRFERSFYPAGGGNEGGLEALHPGENRGLRKRNRSISSCLSSPIERQLYRRTQAHFLLVENGGVCKLRHCYVVSFAAVIRVVTQCSSQLKATHSSSAFLSLN